MANTTPAIVSITVSSIAKTFNSVTAVNYDFTTNRINIVDATGSFYFGYNSITTVTHVVTNGVTTITIS